jgi:hypothetical protein
MMVRIRYKTGTVRNVPAYVGKRLVERRIADYEPEAPQVEQPPAPVVEQPPAPVVEAAAPAEPVEQAVDLDALTRDELYALAVERGLEPHHKTGEAKLRAMLR